VLGDGHGTAEMAEFHAGSPGAQTTARLIANCYRRRLLAILL
jgi:hypothetical protein